jgi:hypothetical protein
MSDDELSASVHKLERYELSWAPPAATYLTLLLMLVPLGVAASLRVHLVASRKVEMLGAQLADVAVALRAHPPPHQPVPALDKMRRGLTVLTIAVVVPVAIILLELALRG